MKRRRRSDAAQGAIVLTALAALTIAGLWAGWRYNEAVYGDGSCMFARCVRVVR